MMKMPETPGSEPVSVVGAMGRRMPVILFPAYPKLSETGVDVAKHA